MITNKFNSTIIALGLFMGILAFIPSAVFGNEASADSKIVVAKALDTGLYNVETGQSDAADDLSFTMRVCGALEKGSLAEGVPNLFVETFDGITWEHMVILKN